MPDTWSCGKPMLKMVATFAHCVKQATPLMVIASIVVPCMAQLSPALTLRSGSAERVLRLPAGSFDFTVRIDVGAKAPIVACDLRAHLHLHSASSVYRDLQVFTVYQHETRDPKGLRCAFAVFYL